MSAESKSEENKTDANVEIVRDEVASLRPQTDNQSESMMHTGSNKTEDEYCLEHLTSTDNEKKLPGIEYSRCAVCKNRHSYDELSGGLCLSCNMKIAGVRNQKSGQRRCPRKSVRKCEKALTPTNNRGSGQRKCLRKSAPTQETTTQKSKHKLLNEQAQSNEKTVQNGTIKRKCERRPTKEIVRQKFTDLRRNNLTLKGITSIEDEMQIPDRQMRRCNVCRMNFLMNINNVNGENNSGMCISCTHRTNVYPQTSTRIDKKQNIYEPVARIAAPGFRKGETVTKHVYLVKPPENVPIQRKASPLSQTFINSHQSSREPVHTPKPTPKVTTYVVSKEANKSASYEITDVRDRNDFETYAYSSEEYSRTQMPDEDAHDNNAHNHGAYSDTSEKCLALWRNQLIQKPGQHQRRTAFTGSYVETETSDDELGALEMAQEVKLEATDDDDDDAIEEEEHRVTSGDTFPHGNHTNDSITSVDSEFFDRPANTDEPPALSCVVKQELTEGEMVPNLYMVKWPNNNRALKTRSLSTQPFNTKSYAKILRLDERRNANMESKPTVTTYVVSKDVNESVSYKITDVQEIRSELCAGKESVQTRGTSTNQLPPFSPHGQSTSDTSSSEVAISPPLVETAVYPSTVTLNGTTVVNIKQEVEDNGYLYGATDSCGISGSNKTVTGSSNQNVAFTNDSCMKTEHDDMNDNTNRSSQTVTFSNDTCVKTEMADFEDDTEIERLHVMYT